MNNENNSMTNNVNDNTNTNSVENKPEIEDLFVNPLEIANQATTEEDNTKEVKEHVDNSEAPATPVDNPQDDNASKVEERPENIGVIPYTTSQSKNNNVPLKSDAKTKDAEVEYKDPSKGKLILLVVFFLMLITFIIFLPDITKMIEDRKNGVYDYEEKVITTGKLKCSMETNTTNLDKSYDLTFQFTNSKLDSAHFSFYTRGDVTLDETALDEMNASCVKLEEVSKSLSGVTIRCTYTPGKFIEEQIFNLSSVDSEALDSAFTEAGGVNPEYEYQQNIDGIEKNLLASGYSCEREE